MSLFRSHHDTGPAPALVVNALHAGYGRARVLCDVALQVDAGERVALVGANGAGKTTLLRVVSGLLRPTSGTVRFGALDLAKLPAHAIARNGVAHVPEGRQVFARQTVLENLLLGAPHRWTRRAVSDELDRVLDRLAVLRDRLDCPAGELSGGQQQILAIGRALMSSPRILLVDELSLGLAPRLADEVADLVRRLTGDGGLGLLVVEQNAGIAIELSQRTYVMRNGKIASEHVSLELAQHDLVHEYLGA